MKMTKATAKVAAVATGLAMATSMLSLAPIAHAATLTTAQVSSILSLLSSFGANSATIANVNAALTGTTVTSGSTTTTSAGSCSFSRSLTIGSTGADVTCLQSALIAGGFSIPAGATGYFGTQTRAAVASWQASRNVAPAVGYFGPISQGAWNLGGTTTTGTTTTTTTTTTSTVAGCAAGAAFSSTTGAACGTTTTTTGGALTGNGRLTNVTSLGNVTSDLEVGDSATSVVGVSADATGGDVAIQRVDTTFTISGTTGSANLDRYVSDVSIYLDGTKLASMDAALGDKDGRVWTYRFSGLNGVIRSGATGQLYVKVTPVSSIGANEDAVSVTGGLAIDSVRAVAADGISDTYVDTAVDEDFTVSSATAGTLTVTTGSDNPVTNLVAVSSSTTSGVTLLSFNLKAKNQAVTITDLPVQIGTSDSLTDVISTVYLMKGTTILSSKTVAAGTFGTTTFTGINQTIAKDATVNYSIEVDLKGDSAYPDDTTLVASTTVYGWDVSDADGATVAPSAAIAGNTQTLTAAGISVAFVSSSATRNTYSIAGSPDSVTDTIVFTIAAGENDIWVEGDIAAAGILPVVGMDGLSWATTTDSTTGTTTAQTGTLTADKSNDLDVITDNEEAFKIPTGTFRTFTFTTTIPSGGANLMVGARITGIKYQATTNSGDVLTGLYTVNLGDFRTTTLQGLTWR
ncbi:MAG: peptidoglycan-binding protein [Candidatus Parcubacteria bacterium]|nr:peptidoglycan-binding protein [Candidatus Parcubacteria bacterium]